MKALLRTQCGCTRVVEIPVDEHRPPTSWSIPRVKFAPPDFLGGDFQMHIIAHAPMDHINGDLRRFTYHHTMHVQDEPVFVYVEA